MLNIIFIIIIIIFFRKIPSAIQIGIILINILVLDRIPYIDEVIMIGLYLFYKLK